MENSEDPDQTPRSATADLCLHRLPKCLSILKVITVYKTLTKQQSIVAIYMCQ